MPDIVWENILPPSKESINNLRKFILRSQNIHISNYYPEIWRLIYHKVMCPKDVWQAVYVKILKIQTPEKFAVITLKFEQDVFTIE